MDWVTQPEIWISLLTLTFLEVVLGIDNIIFISILAGKLPEAQREKARKLGLGLAMLVRVLLLLCISWILGLNQPLFTIQKHDVTWRHLIFLFGGLFLIWKSTHEIHVKMEGSDGEKSSKVVPNFTSVILQILVIDIVFSLDSVITAVGMAKQVGVMIAAVIISMLFMMQFAGKVGEFINRHPSFQMLALSFLILIGVALIGEGLGREIPKGYIYFAMFFSAVVEMLNIRLRSKKDAGAVTLKQPYT